MRFLVDALQAKNCCDIWSKNAAEKKLLMMMENRS